MKIAKFKVSKYRSILDSKIIDVHSMSVLVGPNNAGKSNILRALVVGLQAIRAAAAAGRLSTSRGPALRYRRNDFRDYDWVRDYPVGLQDDEPSGVSIFEFEMELNEKDRYELRKSTGHNLNDLLKLRVRLGKEDTEVKIIKRGPANSAINDNLDKICRLVDSRIQVEYVAAERTSEALLSLIQREAIQAIGEIDHDPKYANALASLRELSEEALRPLEDRLTEGIAALVPTVKGVKLELPRFQAPLRRNDFEVLIDDGTPTLLSAKGDGIQSLAVIAMIRALARRSEDRTYILAIEEPEAHLHPEAVRQMRFDLSDFAQHDQVIITTHSPILVNRDEVSANIVVENNAAAPAKSLLQIRESLGVQLPDNMQSAEVVVLTEGANDVRILSEVLRRRSSVLARALTDGRLQLTDSLGSGNVPYQCRLQREAVCRVHVVLDDDKAGRQALRKLQEAGDIDTRDITILKKAGMLTSEIEDLFDETIFSGFLKDWFNVDITLIKVDEMNDFSTRMRSYFEESGRPWSASVEANLKNAISCHFVESKGLVTAPAVEGLLQNLQATLEGKVQQTALGTDRRLP